MYLDRYRKESEKSMAQVAKELDTTPGTIRFWLTGTRPPGKNNLKRLVSLLSHLGCSLDQLMGESGQDDPFDAQPFDQPFSNIMGRLGPYMTPELKAHIIGVIEAAQPKGTEIPDLAQYRPDFVVQEGPKTTIVEAKSSGKAKAPETRITRTTKVSGVVQILDPATGSGSFLVNVMRALQSKPSEWLVHVSSKKMKVEEISRGPEGQEERHPVTPDPEETRLLMEIWEKQKPKLMQQQDDQAKKEGLVLVKKGKGGKG